MQQVLFMSVDIKAHTVIILTSLFIHSGLLVTENHYTITNDNIMVKHKEAKGN